MSEKQYNFGGIIVKWLQAPVNPSDLNQIEGSYALKPSEFPAIAGNEGVGRVVDIANDTQSGFKIGDLVIPARPLLGTWSQSGSYAKEDLIKVPAGLNLRQAATLIVNPPTAFRLLKDHPSANKLIIQNGANSFVGRMITRMAGILGISTVNLIRDRPGFDELCRDIMGSSGQQNSPGSALFTSQNQNLDCSNAPKSSHLFLKAEGENPTAEILKHFPNLPDLAFNCVGGAALNTLTGCLASNSLIVTYGGMSRRPCSISASDLIFKNFTFKGFWVSDWYRKHSLQERMEMLEGITEWYRKGLIEVPEFEEIKLKEFEGDFSNESKLKKMFIMEE